MIGEYLKGLLEECPALLGANVNLGYLAGDDFSVGIFDISSERTVRSYSDGAKIYARDFRLLIRIGSGGGENARHMNILEDVCSWFNGLGKNDTFPGLVSGAIPVSAAVTGGPELTADETHSAKYGLECMFSYLR